MVDKVDAATLDHHVRVVARHPAVVDEDPVLGRHAGTDPAEVKAAAHAHRTLAGPTWVDHQPSL
ncbi:hypothetical protein GCM10022242_19610 [Nocardioides panacisoli]|uniref:Uncharacterized protein n=1 Tax=Nocardioides panacisoli TaxID=627624 RepID=A0ABP7IG88_9ACTN